MSNAPLSVCVVGGGFTGATAAVACLSHIKAPFRLVMIEGTTSLGRGVAYGSHHPLNLLNVRARDLSIRAGQPADFLNWAFRQLDQGENQADLHEALAHTFLPRQLFGDYVRQRLFEAVERRPDVAFTVVTATALDVTSDNGRYRIELDRAESVAVDVVILATALACNDLTRPARLSEEFQKGCRTSWCRLPTSLREPSRARLLRANTRAKGITRGER